MKMPVAFIGHGSPLNVVDEARYQPWRDWSKQLPRPEAVLVVSAHWQDSPVSIGSTSAHDELLYDYYGFPEFMYRIAYPAPGAPALADRVEELFGAHTQVLRTERPLDHGAFIPLIHLFPSADIPILEISMPIGMNTEELYELGGELAPLRDEGVLILGSGNLVHDIRNMTPDDAAPPEYATDFDRWVENALIARDHRALVAWMEAAPEPLRSHPSAEHYRPVVVAAGAARGDTARFPVEGFEHGSISRRSVYLD